MKKILETERLYLREFETEDMIELSKILTDEETMSYYPRKFTEQEVVDWINWNIENYKKYQFGLWAIILKENGKFIGDCGITLQNIEGKLLPELGYHVNKKYWKRGYASEASQACIKYAFDKLGLEKIYTYTKYSNLPSIRIAEKNGMKYLKSFKKMVMGIEEEEVLYGYERIDFRKSGG